MKPLLYALLSRLCAENGHSALKDTGSLARRLLDATLSKLHLEIDDLEPSPQRPPQTSSYLRGASNSADPVASNIIGSVTGFEHLLDHCFMCLLEDHGMSLLRHSHENLSEAITRLPPKDPERNNSMAPWPYGPSRATSPAPSERLLISLVMILQKYQLLDPPSFVGDLFMLLFTRYILPDQPKNPPQPSLGWTHKPRFCYRRNPSRDNNHIDCHECGLMQDFILSPDQEQGRFTYAKKIRSHLEHVLPSQHYRCRTDTTRGQGGFQTLVVTKISKDTEYNEDIKNFCNKVRQYEQRLLPFRQPVVRRLLGDEIYNSLIMLGPAPAVLGKRAAYESLDQPASSRQRMGNVIDLTEE